jgi:hypothetical protein
MSGDYLVHKAGLVGENWSTVCRAVEAKARELYLRQPRLYSVGRCRLLDPAGKVVAEGRATPPFSSN